MVFPKYQVVVGKPTINQARGWNRATIGDRMDLTLECIRRHYAGDSATPLGETLARYADFFDLLTDFRGYVDFFLLQDLVTLDYSAVNFFTDFDGTFSSSAVPRDLATYTRFRKASIAFVLARNARIAAWATEHLSQR